MNADLIFRYFPNLNTLQRDQFMLLETVYRDWNQKINVVSRKDIDELYLKHVLHSLGIAKVQQFKAGTCVIDVGTGGGFPGIPLAIIFPEVRFDLADSIGKKIKVVECVVEALGLKNVAPIHARVEAIKKQYDFVISRAVATMPTFERLINGKIKKESIHKRNNGILYLKGGDLREELKNYKCAEIYELRDYFEEEFFETKKLVYLPLNQT